MRLTLLVFLFVLLVGFGYGKPIPDKPNFVILFADDLGFGDLSCFGHPTIKTPNLDRMAETGRKYTQWYSAWSLCSPSRAALLTGRIPLRSGIGQVLGPVDKGGIPANETLIPELLKTKGYVSGHIGKWHLGIGPRFLPTDVNNGFDYYWGVPYSVDMGGQFAYPCPPNNSDCYTYLPVLENKTIAQQPVNLDGLEIGYAERVVNFIEKNKENPFFLYMAFSHSHVSFGRRQWNSGKFNNSSPRGMYGDAVTELDWVAGQIIDTLARLGLDKKTLVVFTSDNGPWLQGLQNGGSAGLLNNGKGSTWEGGIRVPAIALWPGIIEPNTISHNLFNTMDLYTTVLSLAGVAAPTDRVIDGLDVTSSLLNDTKSPHKYMFFWNGLVKSGYVLCAVRSGPYKVHYITGSDFAWAPVVHDPPLLYNIDQDPSEKYPLDTSQYKNLLAEFDIAVAEHRKNMVFGVDQKSLGIDPNLAICCNKATNCVCNQ